MSNIVPLQDIQQMAEVAATSKMFGFKNQQEAMAIMLLCQAENLHPAVAMRDYHVIQGRPALKADAMLARFQQAGGQVNWKVYTDEQVTGVFSHPSGGTLEVTWTLNQAKSIGIANKDNWRNYPRAMLRARVLSEGIRSVYPGCVVGVYTPEEVADFTPAKDMGVAERVDTNPQTVAAEIVEDGAFKILMPNGEVYSSHHTTEEWTTSYANLAAKINNSTKFSEEERKDKLAQLRKANEGTVASFKTLEKINLKAELAKVGVSPKVEQSQTQAATELSDTVS